jgi:hypothetical protein
MFLLRIISSFFKMDKTLVTVKVTKESQTVLDWYVVSVSTEAKIAFAREIYITKYLRLYSIAHTE